MASPSTTHDSIDLPTLTDPEKLKLACRRACVPLVLDLLRAGWNLVLPDDDDGDDGTEGTEPWAWGWKRPADPATGRPSRFFETTAAAHAALQRERNREIRREYSDVS